MIRVSPLFSDGIKAAYTPHLLAWGVQSILSPSTLLCHASKSSFNLHSSLYHFIVNYSHFFSFLFSSPSVSILNLRSYLHRYNLKVKCPLLKVGRIFPYSVKSFCGVSDETKRNWIRNATGRNLFNPVLNRVIKQRANFNYVYAWQSIWVYSNPDTLTTLIEY